MLDGADACRLKNCTLNQDPGLALWSNAWVQVRYRQVAHHSLSLYLRGGYHTRRVDGPACGYGAPDKLCLMPADGNSHWEVGEHQEFLHLYISDGGLWHLALETFDCDPRRVELPDLTFFEQPQINATCCALLQLPWAEGVERLQLQEGAYALMAQLIRTYVGRNGSGAPLKGGLSRRQFSRVRDYIEAHYGAELNLEQLAETAGLSPFHFARMFKLSTGLTSPQYVN